MTRYIDADKFHEWVYPNWSYCAQNDDDFHNAIDKQPTADVVPVIHAHWIESKTFEEHRIMLMCSHCTSVYDIDKPKKIMYRYCPHCGAKMDEEVE